MIFVDAMQPTPPGTDMKQWKYAKFCHLVSDADDVQELIRFGKRLKLKKEWLQWSRSGVPHFDLTESKRTLAVRSGATELSPSAFGEKLRAGDFRPDSR